MTTDAEAIAASLDQGQEFVVLFDRHTLVRSGRPVGYRVVVDSGVVRSVRERP